MNYLVTGGYGFIGSHLVEKLIESGHNITILDNLSNGHLENLANIHNETFYRTTDVQDCDKVDFSSRGERIKFDGIFHLATAPRSASLTNPKQDIEVNCKGMIAVLELARKHDAKVVFTSNSGIYGPMSYYDDIGVSFRNIGINEYGHNVPTTPYDADKLVAEYYCKIYHNVYGVRSCVVRFATVYGERQTVNEVLNWRPLVATFVKNVVNNEEVVVNGDGEQTRDLIYVKDAVQGVIKAMDSNINDADIFLLSTNTETSVNTILKTVEAIAKNNAKMIKFTEPLKGDIKRMRYDYSKANKVLGFEPQYSLQQGIREMVKQLLVQT